MHVRPFSFPEFPVNRAHHQPQASAPAPDGPAPATGETTDAAPSRHGHVHRTAASGSPFNLLNAQTAFNAQNTEGEANGEAEGDVSTHRAKQWHRSHHADHSHHADRSRHADNENSPAKIARQMIASGQFDGGGPFGRIVAEIVKAVLAELNVTIPDPAAPAGTDGTDGTDGTEGAAGAAAVPEGAPADDAPDVVPIADAPAVTDPAVTDPAVTEPAAVDPAATVADAPAFDAPVIDTASLTDALLDALMTEDGSTPDPVADTTVEEIV